MEQAYLLLGTNLGDKKQNLQTAIALLITQLAPYLRSKIKESTIIETEPQGFQSDNTFLNQAIGFQTTIGPHDLLKICQWVEQKMGRPKHEPQYDTQGKRIYTSRIIDIDILLYGDQIINTPDLQIPHPRLQEREFALKPLQEIL